MIVGSKAFVGRARHIRKGLGGGMRQAGVVSAPARVAVEETFLGGKLEGARERAREIARRWEERGGRLKYPVETNMVWLDLEAAGVDAGMFVERGVEKGLKVIGARLVVHYREYPLFIRDSADPLFSAHYPTPFLYLHLHLHPSSLPFPTPPTNPPPFPLAEISPEAITRLTSLFDLILHPPNQPQNRLPEPSPDVKHDAETIQEPEVE